MASEMVNRMAQALFEGRLPERKDVATTWPKWAAMSEIQRFPYIMDARFVLAAMREPTDSMVAGAMPWSDAAGAIETWRAMVEEALR